MGGVVASIPTSTPLRTFASSSEGLIDAAVTGVVGTAGEAADAGASTARGIVERPVRGEG